MDFDTWHLAVPQFLNAVQISQAAESHASGSLQAYWQTDIEEAKGF